jgi:hypothetical protein
MSSLPKASSALSTSWVGHPVLRQVAGEDRRLALDFACGVRGDVRVEVVDQYLRPLLGEQLGGRAPDAARRARDDRRLALECSH